MNIGSLAGQQFGQYKLESLLGSGGMGAVYRAEQTSLGRLVAVKVLNIDLADDESMTFYLERFTREAKTSAALEHPHIVPIYDYGTQNQISYVVMRMLTGGSLSERIDHSVRTERPLPSLGESAEILRQLGSALDYAHTHGVIHRDVKASNVMFDDHGTAFVVDFGIAKLVNSTNALTQTGMTMGTPLYMAPEQWRGEDLTGAADQYALGVIAYSMVTGKMPFDGDTMYTVMHKHLNEPAPTLKQYREDVPDSLVEVMHKVLAKDPADRFENVSDFARAFADASASEKSSPTRFFITPLPAKSKPKSSGLLDGPTTGSEIAASASGANQGPLAATYTPGGSPVAPAQPPMPSGAAGLGGATTPLPMAASGGGSNRLVLAGGALVIIAAILAGIFVLGGGDNLSAEQVSASETALASLNAPTVTDTATATDTPTETPSATASATTTATLTDTPTATQTPSDTPTATSSIAQLRTERDLVARLGPGTQFPSLATLGAGETLEILGISEDASWYKVLLSDGSEGWIVTTSVFVSAFGPLESVRIAQAPTATPPDTATPTHTATATATATPTSTDTPTETATATATASITPSHTPTATASATATLRPTETHTATLPPTLRPTATPTALVCPGSLPSRLYIGISGRVADEDPRPLNVRSGPGTAESRVDQLRPLQSFDVVDGPLCRDGYTWYRVTYDDGLLSGWIAESDLTAYFIEPNLAAPGGQPEAPRDGGDSVLLPTCAVIVQDNFDDPDSMNDWFIGRSSRSEVRVNFGSYEIVLGDVGTDNEATSWGSLRGIEFDDAIFEAVFIARDFTRENDSRTGLWLNYLDESSFLAFMISSDGQYRIAYWGDDQYNDIVRWTNHPAINTGANAVNAMRIEKNGDRYQLFINGRFADAVTHSGLEGKRVAFFGASTDTPTLFRMDMFRACRA